MYIGTITLRNNRSVELGWRKELVMVGGAGVGGLNGTFLSRSAAFKNKNYENYHCCKREGSERFLLDKCLQEFFHSEITHFNEMSTELERERESGERFVGSYNACILRSAGRRVWWDSYRKCSPGNIRQ